ncbi:hypothetical protein OIDMADRAFT_55225 [Oidiodendron maius Zn]|uniref:Uncharacterized protein n=1 Tax=Oidiodendron maius (strain Zn) TaxID=913774 RepID=A0A0C3CNU0_OIDMZ|nr:hypothetical protein OIDMADRAFT_55225 [Oidiodendron maius Zn]
MSKGKRRSRTLSWDGEVSGTEENYVNGAGSTNHRVGAVEVVARENDNRDDNAADPVNGATPHENGASRDNRDNRELSLGPWTQAVSGAVQSMGATQRALKVLQDKFKRHVDELTEVDDAKV